LLALRAPSQGLFRRLAMGISCSGQEKQLPAKYRSDPFFLSFGNLHKIIGSANI